MSTPQIDLKYDTCTSCGGSSTTPSPIDSQWKFQCGTCIRQYQTIRSSPRGYPSPRNGVHNSR